MTLLPLEAIFTSGSTLYVVSFGTGAQAGKVWNPTLNTGLGAWATYNPSDWSQYPTALVEKSGSGYYAGVYPSLISNILTTDVVYLQAGGSPALGDISIASGRSQGNNVAAIGGASQSAANLGASAGSMLIGAAAAGTLTATAFTTNLASSVNNAYQGRVVLFTSGALVNQVGNIIAYNGATKLLTVGGPFTSAPSAADTFVIV